MVALLERRLWASLPAEIRGHELGKEDEERILGFGEDGV
jgi:hypothetical protein